MGPVADGAKLCTETGMELRCITAPFGEMGNDVNSVLNSVAEQQWYAAYTRPKHEKRVAAELDARVVEQYLPLYRSVRLWSDRSVEVKLPLFPGYVFVRIALRERLRVLQIPSVVRLVGFNGLPTPLAESEMEVLRAGLDSTLCAEPCPYLRTGSYVRLKSGPLRGLRGILKEKKSGYRFVVSLELIQRSISVEVDAADIEGDKFATLPPIHAQTWWNSANRKFD